MITATISASIATSASSSRSPLVRRPRWPAKTSRHGGGSFEAAAGRSATVVTGPAYGGSPRSGRDRRSSPTARAQSDADAAAAYRGSFVTGPLNFADESASLGQLADRLTLVSGSAFCISDVTGTISSSRPHGLFLEDTRVLSRLELRVDGHLPEPLTSFASGMRSATIVARTRRPEDGWSLLVLRRRSLDPSFRETVTLRNVSSEIARCDVTLALAADHASVFEVKDQRPTTRTPLDGSPIAGGVAFVDEDRRTVVTFD